MTKTTVAAASKGKEKEAPFVFDEDNMPLICPNEACQEPVPEDPSPALVKMFCGLHKLVYYNGPFVKGVALKEAEICIEITAQNKVGSNSHLAKLKGWPVSIDFPGLLPCILAMKKDLDKVLTVAGVKEQSLIWTYLNENLHNHGIIIEKLKRVNMVPMNIFRNAHPG